VRRSRHILAASLVLALTVASWPASAGAARLPGDRIGGVAVSEGAHPTTIAPDVGAAAGVLVTSDGREVWGRKPLDRRAMASITKVMTALIVLEQGRLDETVTVSAAASKVPYAVGLQAGEQVSVRTLLELALVASSNDAALALAEHAGGSVPAFVELMNARADRLGLTGTTFANPHGLDAAGHKSTAADLAVLARAAMADAEFRRIVALRSVPLPARGSRGAATLKSTDELLGRYEGLLGVKTGFTDDAKYSFVACAERDGVVLTAVVLGTATEGARFADTRRLLDWGFEHVSLERVATTTETVGSCAIAGCATRAVPVRFAETTAVPVFDLGGEVTRTVALDSQVGLPVFEGQRLGSVKLRQGEDLLAELPVVAAEDVASVAETVGAVPVTDYLDLTVTARASDEPVDVAEFDDSAPVERTVSLDPGVQAPVRAGSPLGEVRYTQGSKVIATVPVVAASDVAAPGAIERVGIWFTRTWRKITGGPTVATVRMAAN